MTLRYARDLQAGIALAGALELNRTLLFQDPDDHVYLGDDYCKDLPAMDSCYFMPLSNCTAGEKSLRLCSHVALLLVLDHMPPDVRDTQACVLSAGLSIPESMPALDFNDPTQTNERFLSEDSGFAPPQFLVPTMFNSLLNASNIPVSRRYYWWRSQVCVQSNSVEKMICHRFLGSWLVLPSVTPNCVMYMQAAAYIVRMNPRTIKAVKALRNKYPQPPSLRNAISASIAPEIYHFSC